MNMRVLVWGTGSSASALLAELSPEEHVIAFVESEPKRATFQGKNVVRPQQLPLDIDRLYIASMFFPEILEELLIQNYPIEKIFVADVHRIDPRHGISLLRGVDELPKLESYKKFRQTIDHVAAVVNAKDPKIFPDKLSHLEESLKRAPSNGTLLELGVYRGETLLFLASLTDRNVWGFDSFKGFPADSLWTKTRADERTVVALPAELLNYAHLKEGFFEQTLPEWLNSEATVGGGGLPLSITMRLITRAQDFVLRNLNPICLMVRLSYLMTSYRHPPSWFRTNTMLSTMCLIRQNTVSYRGPVQQWLFNS